MRRSKDQTDHDWLDDSVEAYLDGELSLSDRDRFEAALGESPDLQASVTAAARVRETLAGIETPACPDAAVSEILVLAARHRSDRGGIERYFGALRPSQRWSQALAIAGVLAVVAASAVFLSRINQEPSEVDKGLADVKLALAYIGVAGRQAGDIVRLEVVDEGMIVPIRRAVGRATGEPGNGGSPLDTATKLSQDQNHETQDE